LSSATFVFFATPSSVSAKYCAAPSAEIAWVTPTSLQHPRGDLPGEGPFLLEVHVLAATAIGLPLAAATTATSDV